MAVYTLHPTQSTEFYRCLFDRWFNVGDCCFFLLLLLFRCDRTVFGYAGRNENRMRWTEYDCVWKIHNKLWGLLFNLKPNIASKLEPMMYVTIYNVINKIAFFRFAVGSSNNQRNYGQKIRYLLACCCWWGIRLWSVIWNEKYALFILRWKYRCRFMEMLIVDYWPEQPKKNRFKCTNDYSIPFNKKIGQMMINICITTIK